MPWWGWLIVWFGSAIIVLFVFTFIAIFVFAAKQGKKIEEAFEDDFHHHFGSKRF